jgi:uncharacterized protein (DUF1800 family)
MRTKRCGRSAASTLAIAGFATLLASAATSSGKDKPVLTEREKAIHVLNRLGFGPRPGDVERVLAMGVSAYIDQQLRPEDISDAAASASLKRFPTLEMTTAELFDKFERPLREARRERQRELSSQDETMASGKADRNDAADEAERIRQMIPPENRPRRIVEELSQARILRAAESERQLNEVLVDFWMNHFNVFAGKGLDRVFITSFERDIVRPRIWGKFEDLLMATAKSPAMLFYLDNAQSAADPERRPPQPLRIGRILGFGLRPMSAPGARQPGNGGAAGLNENYARELMELHTLGVDGGYTQGDVTDLARLLTGWSIVRPEQGTGFVFRARLHDIGAKTVLGWDFPVGGGIEEGERMIHILALHPSTARRIASKLCQRFVADEPPKELVDRVARKFLSTGGDLRETVRAVVTSPEFFDPRYYRAKIKSPFEYVVSAVRAVGAVPDNALPIARQLAQLGEPLYLCQPPTGYSDAAQAWVNTGALVARLNFALQLAANKLPGTWTDVERLIEPESAADAKKAAEALSCALMDGELSSETKRTLEERIGEGNPGPAIPLIAGLILGSPEFQRQ